jgi:choline dehydrogenase-like flavoprotein
MKSFSTFATVASLLVGQGWAYPNSVHQAQHFTRSSDIKSSYDYIIVGGGTSGLTVADRLTESGKCLSPPLLSHLNLKLTQPPDSVLVIEYGYFSDIPGLAYDPFNPIDTSPPSLMYNITSVGTVQQFVGVGCVVGGGSAINTQVWMRGTSEDYDRWAAIGGEGSTWGWDGILPYFKKASLVPKEAFP